MNRHVFPSQFDREVPFRKPVQRIDEEIHRARLLVLEQDLLHARGIRRPSYVRSLSVLLLLHRFGQRGDVVGEQEVLFRRDFHPVNIDVRFVFMFLEDLSVLYCRQDFLATEQKEKTFRLLDVCF